MNNVQEFKDWLVIDHQEQFNQFGHFPFQMFFEDDKGKGNFAALLLGKSEECYKVFHKAMRDGAQRAYMSVDFPPMEGHIDTDFIAVFSFDGKKMDLVAIPYNGETGERLPEISYQDSDVLKQILRHFSQVCLEEAGVIKKEE